MRIVYILRIMYGHEAILKSESGTSLDAVQYTWQPGSALMVCSYISRMASLDTLLFYFMWDSKSVVVVSLLLNFVPKSRLLFL